MATREKLHSATEADVEHKVLKYKSYLETNQNGSKVLYIFTRLSEMFITIAILQKTGIGKVVNSFRKKDGEIGELARNLVAGWKSMVAQRLEAEDEARESASQVNSEDKSGSESQPDNSSAGEDVQSGNETSEEVEKIENKCNKNAKYSSDVSKENSSSKSNNERNVRQNEQKESKSDKVRSHRHKEKDTLQNDHDKHKHGNSDSKHKNSESKHRHSENKHKHSENKHTSSENKHQSSESKHKHSENKHTSSENRHKSTENKHKSSEDKSSSSRHSSSNNKHKSSESKFTEDKQENTERKENNLGSKYKVDVNKHKKDGQHKNEQKEKEAKNSIQDDHVVKSETSKNMISPADSRVSSEFNKKTETKDDSDSDPLHWEMLESFEQENSPQHEQFQREKKEVSEENLLSEQNLEGSNRSVFCDSMKSTECERTHDGQVLTSKKEKEHSKDRESKHKHREKSSKSHHSEKKESSTEKEKHHRDELGHKSKHSKHKHKHSDKEKEHKHSKHKELETGEITQKKRESEKQSLEKEAPSPTVQLKERGRSSILESLTHEVDEGKFVTDDLPGLWFLNSNNNSLLAHKDDMESSKLKVPCENSNVKVDSKISDKKQDSTIFSDQSLTSENDKKDKKRHKHSKDRESSSKKHKSDKDSRSKHDSKHHHDKKRKHSGDADHSKPSKTRRTSSQDGMSFEDLLMAGASKTKHSQPSKLSQNDYAKLKSKFKVKKKGDNVSTKKVKDNLDLQVTDEDILGALPQPNTHYRPWRLKEVEEKKKTDEELLDAFIAGTKTTGRTQMYSGKKQNFVPEVYKLFDVCMKVLCNNIDSLEFVGGVPFTILKPVLEKCTAAQLYRLEDFNPHFLEESDSLWMNHCHKDFRLSKPEEMETWREHYLRKFDEREEKLKKISANINASLAKKVPERTTQLAYIDSAAKPPRNVRRQQAKYGTAGPSSGERSRARFLPSMDPIPVGKPKAMKTSAPMMAKTLTMMKKIRR
ncbi:transcription elongation factor B polypeptide 3-like [Ylistrum balloti]|uniref:transcription elongation factor B polypeptide 3-like n=1 Tax=Ylistrum balloti TaxID=509963 RepID=UPI002905E2FB|nr:transcription elongation factor B polypeptide 3-like [Ylistrum balloti]